VNPRDIPCASIADISADDVAQARRSGRAIRQVSWAERVDGDPARVRSSVGPALVAADSPVARARGCDNVIVVTGELGGDTVYSGQGAGGNPTAVAVVSDLLAIAADRPAPDHPSPFLVHSTASKGPQHHA
jgi:homoserine dehydrogenase